MEEEEEEDFEENEENQEPYNEFEDSEVYDSEDNFSIEIKQEPEEREDEMEEMFEEIETLEEQEPLENPVEYDEIGENEEDGEVSGEPLDIKVEAVENVEIIYLSPEYFEENEPPLKEKRKPQAREFKAESDPHRYILETSKVYFNRGKNQKKQDEVRNMPCPHCSKKFPDLSRLNKHIATHSIDRPFKCPIDGCDKDYKAPHHLKKHFYTHTVDLNRTAVFTCDFDGCYKVFGFACDLKIHKLTHEMKVNPELKKFQCEVCLKRFAKSNHLQKHALIHIPDDQVDWIECPEGCGKKFRHIDNVNQHLASHGYEKFQYAKKRKLRQSEQYLVDLSQE